MKKARIASISAEQPVYSAIFKCMSACSAMYERGSELCRRAWASTRDASLMSSARSPLVELSANIIAAFTSSASRTTK